MCLCLACGSAPALALTIPPISTQPEAFLVTYAPGEVYWQRFGHNAIWIRDRARRVDHLFNFGFFDFQQENFLWNFIRGKMKYFAAARSPQDEFPGYIAENRTISLQKLDLKPHEVRSLSDYLITQVQPSNREYLYDYYINNCSTRIRDALDSVFGEQLREQAAGMRPQTTFRSATRQLTQQDYWLNLGLQIVIGPYADQPISYWDNYFLPGSLADGVAGLDLDGSPVSGQEIVLFESSTQHSHPQPGWIAWRYLPLAAGFALLLLLFSWVGAKNAGTAHTRYLLFWSLSLLLVGLVLVFVWVATDHQAMWRNDNLLLFNPLLAVFAWRIGRSAAGWRRYGYFLLVLVGLIAGLGWWLLGPRYGDEFMLILPGHLLAIYALIKLHRATNSTELG